MIDREVVKATQEYTKRKNYDADKVLTPIGREWCEIRGAPTWISSALMGWVDNYLFLPLNLVNKNWVIDIGFNETTILEYHPKSHIYIHIVLY